LALVNRTLIVVVAAALFVGACGESAEPSRSPAAAPEDASDRTALVNKANRICREAQPGLDQTSEQIQAAKTTRATRAAWTAQYGVVSDLFVELRAAEKAGVDKRYDVFLSKLGRVLTFVEAVADGHEEDGTFDAMQTFVNEMGHAAIAAQLTTCLETFRPASERQG
jgi:hypothetical protein